MEGTKCQETQPGDTIRWTATNRDQMTEKFVQSICLRCYFVALCLEGMQSALVVHSAIQQCGPRSELCRTAQDENISLSAFFKTFII